MGSMLMATVIPVLTSTTRGTITVDPSSLLGSIRDLAALITAVGVIWGAIKVLHSRTESAKLRVEFDTLKADLAKKELEQMKKHPEELDELNRLRDERDNALQKEIDELNKRYDSLGTTLDKMNDYLDRDQKWKQVVNRGIQALLAHAIDGNNIGKCKDAEAKFEEYLFDTTSSKGKSEENN